MSRSSARVGAGMRWVGLGALLLLAACGTPGPGPAPGARGLRPGLVRRLQASLPSLGLITGIRPAPEGGVIAAGPGGAVRVDAAGAVSWRARAPGRHPSGVIPLALGRRVALVGRGPDGSLTLFDAGGHARAEAPPGAHDLAAGDLDGDGRLDLVAGLPKDEGLRRMDPQGRVRWTRSAVDPWEITLADTNGDGIPEIVHSNRQGAFVVRDADGRVRHRFETGRRARHFAVVSWPGRQARILQRSGDGIDLYTPEGRPVAHLKARVSNDEGPVEAVAFDPRGDGQRWLAVLDRLYGDAPSVLSVFDPHGRRVHEEVFLQPCASLGSLDGSRLLVGCKGRLWRYELGLVDPATVLSVPAVQHSGDAFGPLHFGDSPERVRAMSTFLPDHTCRLAACDSSYLKLDGRYYLLVPEFVHGGLARVALLALPEPSDTYDETRAEWHTLVRLISARHGRPERKVRAFPTLREVDRAPAQAGWRAFDTHRWSDASADVEAGVATLDAKGPLQYVAYASFRRPSLPASR